MPDNPSPVAGSAPFRLDNGAPVARALPHPAGRLVVATPQTKAGLSRQAKAGTAFRVAPNVYIVGASLAPEQAGAHHRTAIVGVFWPGAVLTDRTALTGGMPSEGWIFVAHPDPGRRSDLELPGVTISPRVGPGPLPGDTPMPDGLHISGPARRLVENVSIAGRPPRGRPSRQAGTEAIEDEIDKLARQGGAGLSGRPRRGARPMSPRWPRPDRPTRPSTGHCRRRRRPQLVLGESPGGAARKANAWPFPG